MFETVGVIVILAVFISAIGLTFMCELGQAVHKHIIKPMLKKARGNRFI